LEDRASLGPSWGVERSGDGGQISTAGFRPVGSHRRIAITILRRSDPSIRRCGKEPASRTHTLIQLWPGGTQALCRKEQRSATPLVQCVPRSETGQAARWGCRRRRRARRGPASWLLLTSAFVPAGRKPGLAPDGRERIRVSAAWLAARCARGVCPAPPQATPRSLPPSAAGPADVNGPPGPAGPAPGSVGTKCCAGPHVRRAVRLGAIVRHDCSPHTAGAGTSVGEQCSRCCLCCHGRLASFDSLPLATRAIILRLVYVGRVLA
jgi:hypothetical protein